MSKETELTYMELKQMEEHLTELYDSTNLKADTYLDVLKAIRDYTKKHDIKK